MFRPAECTEEIPTGARELFGGVRVDPRAGGYGARERGSRCCRLGGCAAEKAAAGLPHSTGAARLVRGDRRKQTDVCATEAKFDAAIFGGAGT